MNRWVMLGLLLAFLVLPSITFSVNALPQTIVVPDDYATIQSAIDAAQDGAVIHVKSGVYHENLKVNKSISIIGESYDSTVIDGNASEGYRAPIRITSNNVTVTGFTISDSWTGISISQVSGCNISGNRLTNNHEGIVLSDASRNNLKGNIIDHVKTNGYGIQLWHASTNNNLERNQITSASIGIAIRDQFISPTSIISSQNNRLIGNTLEDCKEYAIMLTFTNDNMIIGNNISGSGTGVSLFESDNNKVYHNNFIGNTRQVGGNLEPILSGGNGTRYSICQWDNGKEGNYWSDYNGADADNDGIGDTPYVINEANSDNLPLMNPVATQEINSDEANADFPSPTPSVTTPVSSSPTPTTTPPTVEPLPVGQIIAVSASAAVAAIGFFVFFRKSKR